MKQLAYSWTSILILAVFAAGAGWLIDFLYDYVRPKPDEPVSNLSYGIYGIGAVALLLAYDHVRRIERELRCCEQVSESAKERLRKLSNTSEGGFKLADLHLLGTSDGGLIVNRIIAHIYSEGKSLKFDSSLNIVSAFKDELNGSMMRLMGMQKVALQLGILGTFVGLAMAFERLRLGGVLDGGAIDRLFNSLTIPFATSIAGLEVAFILWLHIDFLLRKQNRFQSRLEHCVSLLMELTRRSTYDSAVAFELHQANEKMTEMSARVYLSNELLSKQLAVTSHGLSELQRVKDEFDSFRKVLKDDQDDFMNAITDLYNSLSPKRIGDELRLNLNAGAKDIASMMRTQFEEVLQQYNKFNESMADLNLKRGQLAQEEMAHSSRIKQEIAEAQQRVATMQEDFIKRMTASELRQELKAVLKDSLGELTKQVKNDLDRIAPELAKLGHEADIKAAKREKARSGWFNRVLKGVPKKEAP